MTQLPTKVITGMFNLNNALEVFGVVGGYFLGVSFAGRFIDNTFDSFDKYMDMYHKKLNDSKLFTLIKIVIQLSIIAILSYVIRLSVFKLTLNYLSNDNDLYAKPAIGVMFAFLLFGTQNNLKKMIKKFYA